MFIRLLNLPIEWQAEHYGHQLKCFVILVCGHITNKQAINICCTRAKIPLSQDLNDFVNSYTVVDCGMFRQPRIWMTFGKLLSDKIFDNLFGTMPLYITTLLRQGVEPTNPFVWQSIAWSSRSKNKLLNTPEMSWNIPYANDPIYTLKHPGNNSRGENFIIANGAYTVFGLQHQKNVFLDQTAVEMFLYNAQQNRHG
jgi:hypothetical protein